jgi:hypothetical protein
METAHGNPTTAGKLRGLEGLFVTGYSIHRKPLSNIFVLFNVITT